MALVFGEEDEERVLNGRIKELQNGIVAATKTNPIVVTISFERMPKIVDLSAFVSLVLLPDEITDDRIFKTLAYMETNPEKVSLLPLALQQREHRVY